MMFTPLFDTSKELYAWLNAQDFESYSAGIYQTRKGRKWRAKYAVGDNDVTFGRNPDVFIAVSPDVVTVVKRYSSFVVEAARGMVG